MNTPRLQPRDLINVGMFTALYFVALLVVVVLGILNPIMLSLGLLLSLFTGALVYMVFLRRAKAFGMITIMGLIIGGLMIVNAHSLIVVAVILASGVVADVIAHTKLPERIRGVASYTVFTLWYIGPLLPLYLKGVKPVAEGTTKNHAASFAPFLTPMGLTIFVVVLVVVSIISAIAAQKIINKHFARAGVV